MISLETALLRLVVALVLGALVGLDREQREHAAGMRTHTLVALGSCLIMIVSAFGFADILGTRAVGLDPSRIAAQVVSGIGFLGAGAILFRKEIVKGLTTAAAIWVVAAIGLACGSGLFPEAVAATILSLIVLRFMQPLEAYLHSKSSSYALRVEGSSAETEFITRVTAACAQNGVKIENMQVQIGRSGSRMDIQCRTTDTTRLTQTITTLRAFSEVQQVQYTLRHTDIARLSLSVSDGDHPANEQREEH